MYKVKRARRGRTAVRGGTVREAETAIHRYFLGEITADSYLRIIGNDTQETVEAKASRARVIQIYDSAAKVLDR